MITHILLAITLVQCMACGFYVFWKSIGKITFHGRVAGGAFLIVCLVFGPLMLLVSNVLRSRKPAE